MNDDAVALYPQQNMYKKMEYSESSPNVTAAASAPAPHNSPNMEYSESTADVTAASSAPAPPNNPLPLLMGPENIVTTCPHCQCAVRTSIKYSVTSRTHLAAAIFCLTCCLCCIPYCSNSAKNTDHYCPNCFKYLGTYER